MYLWPKTSKNVLSYFIFDGYKIKINQNRKGIYGLKLKKNNLKLMIIFLSLMK